MKNPIAKLICTMLLGFSFLNAKANSSVELNTYSISILDTIAVSDTIQLRLLSSADSIPHKSPSSKEMKRKKFVSSILALPFPFGFIGAHRVMLGCKPWVPVVYVATLGGCFGLLPLIDFCVLAFSKDISQYENNPQIFMWLK